MSNSAHRFNTKHTLTEHDIKELDKQEVLVLTGNTTIQDINESELDRLLRLYGIE